jgi:glutamine synthetase
MCGRTLFGAKPPKGQELEDHYFGAIRPRVAAYMKDLDTELWKLGVLSKTKHNEVAPSQHEMAPIYSDANSACDHNQLTMEMMKRVANRHDLVCLLHEKPFAGVNGSGKHDNWSLSTDTGKNLFKPGDTPSQNAQFLLFLCAFIKGVDEYQDFCAPPWPLPATTTVSAPGGAPAIVSIFLGDELNAVVESIIAGTAYRTPASGCCASAWTCCPPSARTTPTATAPPPSPSPATSSSSGCWAPPSPSPGPTSP